MSCSLSCIKGSIKLLEVKFEKSYTITGEGKGGGAGFVRGQAKVELIKDLKNTNLKFDVEVKICGKIAELGSRLLEGFSKNMAKKTERSKNALMMRSQNRG